MIIRKAEEKDISRLNELLKQVLEIHAKIRPDIFIPNTTKYTDEELRLILSIEDRPIFVAVDANDYVCGYAFCIIKNQPFTNNMIQSKSLFIDDLCVDEKYRGRGIGKKLFEFLKSEAEKLDCYDITLNVWSGNERAEKFYENLGMKTKERQLEYIIKK